MEKLTLTIVASIIIVGICTWVFLGNTGVNKSVQDGYDRLKVKARSYGYKPGP